MAITTYTELQAAIQNWLDNDNANVVATIPDSIALAEAKFSRDLRLWEMENRILIPLVPAVPVPGEEGYYALPDDWNGYKSVARQTDNLLVNYWQRLTPLSNINTTNWLLDKHPDLYLYASLVELSQFSKSKDEATIWSANANAAMQEIIATDWSTMYGGVPSKIHQPLSDDNEMMYISPTEYDALESSGSSDYLPSNGVFTVSASYLRIWPKP